MANDIETPLLLNIDFKTLYAIDLNDNAFGGEWPEQKQSIKDLMISGSTRTRVVYSQYEDVPIQEFSSAEIISDHEDDICWTLVFKWCGAERKLVHRDSHAL